MIHQRQYLEKKLINTYVKTPLKITKKHLKINSHYYEK